MSMPEWNKIGPPRPTIKPKGKFKIIDVELNQNKAAIFPRIIMVDEAGKLWQFKGSQFIFDLNLVGEGEQ